MLDEKSLIKMFVKNMLVQDGNSEADVTEFLDIIDKEGNLDEIIKQAKEKMSK